MRKKIVITILTGIVITIILFPLIGNFRFFFYDSFMSINSVKYVSNKIVVVKIDERSLSKLGRWPWKRDVIAQLINSIKVQSPSVISVDILFPESTTGDSILLNAFKGDVPIILPVYFTSQPLKPVIKPINAFSELNNVNLGHINLNTSNDGVVRTLYNKIVYKNSRYYSFALKSFFTETDKQSIKIPVIIKEKKSGVLTFNLLYYIPFTKDIGKFLSISAYDLINNRSKFTLKDKIVLVGFTAAGLGDLNFVPVSSEIGQIPGIYTHANIINSLITNHFISPVSFFKKLLFFLGSLLLIALLLFVFIRYSVVYGLIGAILFLFITIEVPYYFFQQGEYIDPVPYLTLIILVIAIHFIEKIRSGEKRTRRLILDINDNNKQIKFSDKISVEEYLRFFSKLYSKEIKKIKISVINLSTGKKSKYKIKVKTNGGNFRKSKIIKEKTIGNKIFRYELKVTHSENIKKKQLGIISKSIMSFMTERLVQDEIEIQKKRKLGSINYYLLILELNIFNVLVKNRLLKNLYNSRNFGVLLFDYAGSLIFSNKFSEELVSSMTKEQNLSFFSFIAEFLKAEKLPSDIILEENLYKQEIEYNIGEENRYFEVTVLPDRGAGYIVVNIYDITDRVEIEKFRNDMMHTLTHDLKNHIFAIKGFAEIIKNESDNNLIEKLGNRTIERSDVVFKFIMDILELFSLENTNELKKEKIIINEVADEILVEINPIVKKSKGKIDIKVNVDIIEGNRRLLKNLMINLILNAVKYGGTPPKVNVSVENMTDNLKISVEDNGNGIPVDERERIFERFYRISSTSVKEGTGVGLSIVKEIVKLHGGKIWIEESSLGGSNFIILLPY